LYDPYSSVTVAEAMGDLTFTIAADQSSRMVISVAGEVDLATSAELVECVQTHADRDVVLELSPVAFLDSAGIGALVRSYQLVHASGHTLRTCGEPDNVRKVLEIGGVLDTLHGDDGD
jgi:anti-sigma B factor antagonist